MEISNNIDMTKSSRQSLRAQPDIRSSINELSLMDKKISKARNESTTSGMRKVSDQKSSKKISNNRKSEKTSSLNSKN
jgi:hypothetical protein